MPPLRRIRDLAVDSLVIGETEVITALLLASGQSVDLNGEAGGLILDADADTAISASSDDVIVIKIANANDFELRANILRALSGSVIETNTINETTAASGVTIDGVLVKDGRTDAGLVAQALTATGAITINSGLVTLAHATVVIAATLDAPVAGDRLIITNTSASGTVAHTVTLGAGVTFVGGSNNTATLDAAGETLEMVAVSATKWLILENIGSVGLSAA